MNMTFDIKRFDQRMHHWEHDLLISSEKLMHSEVFWAMIIVGAFVALMILLAVFAPAGTRPIHPYPLPGFPMY
jgi:hypothetical protein